jgi:hypothetical protein
MTPLTPRQIAVRDAVVEHYLKERKGLSVREIAVLLKWPESRVRRTLEPSGTIDGLAAMRDERPTYSRDFPAMQTGNVVPCRVYHPALWYLRDMVLELRAKAPVAAEAAS